MKALVDQDNDVVAAWTEVVAGVSGAQDEILADVQRHSGVSAAAFVVLSTLHAAADGELSMHLLASRLGMTSGGFTKLADRLQAAGLIERRASAHDRRVVLAVLTPPGTEAAEAAIAAYNRSVHTRVGAVLAQSDLSGLQESAQRLARYRAESVA